MEPNESIEFNTLYVNTGTEENPKWSPAGTVIRVPDYIEKRKRKGFFYRVKCVIKNAVRVLFE